MYQLRNLIRRTNVPSDPQNNMNAAEDYFRLIVHAHVVAAAKTVMKFNPQTSVKDLARLIITNYMRFPETDSTKEDKPITTGDDDKVYVYATELLTLGLLWHGFHDSIKEGDGERIARHWKFLLIIFKVAKRYNYAKEAVNFLLQLTLLSERQKAQLLWSRCVNTRGTAGENIPGDLHNEHLNRRLKSIIAGQGSSVNSGSVLRAGKLVKCIQDVCEQFEKETRHEVRSTKHNVPNFGKDFDDVIKTLSEENIFVPISDRQHESFSFKCGILQKLSHTELLKKVNHSIQQLI